MILCNFSFQIVKIVVYMFATINKTVKVNFLRYHGAILMLNITLLAINRNDIAPNVK